MSRLRALTPLDRRIELLGAAGADAVLVLRFTPEMAAVSAENFAIRVLFDGLRAEAIVVGRTSGSVIVRWAMSSCCARCAPHAASTSWLCHSTGRTDRCGRRHTSAAVSPTGTCARPPRRSVAISQSTGMSSGAINVDVSWAIPRPTFQ
ncbi:MAG: hypothetical protein WKF73_20515 [Nocardioidaceae bacterium]